MTKNGNNNLLYQEHVPSLKDILLAVLSTIVGLFSTTFDSPLISCDRVDVLVVLLHDVLLFVEPLEDLLVYCFHNFDLLQLFGKVLVLFVRSIIELLSDFVFKLFFEYLSL